MRPSVLGAYVAMLPRLQAEESLRRVAELQAAHPELDADARREILDAWQGQAQPGAPRITREEHLGGLAAMGFEIVEAGRGE